MYSSTSKQTLKSKVQEYICCLIRENKMQEGDKLPTQREIACLLQVSPRVAELAMRELDNNGVISRTIGRGSFVAKRDELRGNKILSKVLLVIPNYTNPIFSLFQERLGRVFFEHGVMVESILTKFLDNDTMFQRICEQRWSGIVGILPERIISFAHSRKIPIVRLVNNIDRRRKYNQLVQDANASGNLVADMLLEQGHRRIVCAGGDTNQNYRFDAIIERFKGKNVKSSIVNEDIPLTEFPDYQLIGRHLVDKIIALHEPPTAIVFSNDARALGGMRALLETGFSIPEDFSIVGFDNIPGSGLFHPALTTVDLGYSAGADTAVEMIISNKMDECYALPQKLILRESTRQNQAEAQNIIHTKQGGLMEEEPAFVK